MNDKTEVEAKAEETVPESEERQTLSGGVSRRAFVGTAALAGASLMSMNAMAQTRAEQIQGRSDGKSESDPGEENKALLEENPNSNLPPFTDHGDPGVMWYSFDLVHKRLQGGGWTHQVTERELPTSKELTGVNMRLTAGSFRELHWHTANEWAFMITGKARVTLMQPDGKMFIDDVSAGDLWFFPAGFPHSIQGLEGDGCEFLLVFDEGDFSEDGTFLVSDWLAHTPPEVVQKNMGWTRDEFDKLPKSELYIFEAPLPGPLEDDKRFLGDKLETEKQYTFKMTSMPATSSTTGGETRVVDSKNFPASTTISSALVRVKPGGIRELHWHPTVSEWQFYLQGKGRMTIFNTAARARTMDFNANDVGLVPTMAGHYIENTGKEDLVFLEMFRAPVYQDVSLNEWIARMPDKMAQAHLKLPVATIRKAPQGKNDVLPK